MSGNSVYGELNNSTLAFQQVDFQLLALRRVGNQTDAVFRLLPWLDVTGGYHVGTRTFQSVRSPLPDGTQQTERSEQSNTQNAGIAGLRLRFAKRISLLLDAEKGTNDNPVYPIGDKSYHALNGRLQYKSRTLLLAVSLRDSYNINQAALSAFSARGRVVSAEASWTPREWFSVDGAYSKLHTATAGGLAYFIDENLATGNASLYLSNLHSGNLWLRLNAGKYATVRLGYSHVQDASDGRQAANAGSGAFVEAQTFPLTYSSPQFQLSVPLGTRIRWNAGCTAMEKCLPRFAITMRKPAIRASCGRSEREVNGHARGSQLGLPGGSWWNCACAYIHRSLTVAAPFRCFTQA
jgi:hypothetical protein